MKQITIVTFNTDSPHKIEKAEDEIAELINRGWVILTAGGTETTIAVIMQIER
jgi:cysteine sulfinate desulfinase/cysteine desulfurase-like protein